jgi:ubiquinone/menaquinone biosynthesis C-methylase UbiE
MDKVVSVFKRNKVKNVLDLGCGAGRNLWYLASKGFKVWGIDLAPSGIKAAKKVLAKKKLHAELVVGNVYKKLPHKDGSFDAVISVQVLQHSNEAEIKSAIKEIKRVLTPGGLVFITLCGRYSKGKVRYCLVKTARKISSHTYVPTCGDEKGLTHFIYTKNKIEDHYRDFKIQRMWKDDKDYYCFIGKLK